jgi:hypothetical protein
MTEKERLKPTNSRPKFVVPKMPKLFGSLDFVRLLSRSLPLRDGIPKGEISGWIQRVAEGPPRSNSPQTDQLLERYASFFGYLFYFFGVQFEPPKLVEVLFELMSSDLRHPEESQGKKDLASELGISKEIAERVGVRVVVDEQVFLPNLRAFQAFVVCSVIHKADPRALITQARNGDRRAVLDLIKVDKLFLHDSCTENVLKKAEREDDRHFLRQVARAMEYEPKIGAKTPHRLYLFTLFGLSMKPSDLIKTQHQTDPQGKIFKGIYSFERFVERCFNEFKKLQETAPADATTANRPSGDTNP